MLGQAPRLGRGEQAGVEDLGLGNAPHFAGEDIAAVLDATDPATLGLVGARVEPPGQRLRRARRARRIARLVIHRHQRAGDRRLFHHAAIVTRMQAAEQMADDTRLLDERPQVGPGALFARRQPQHGPLEPVADEVVFAGPLVLEVLLGGAALHLVERRLGDEDVAAVDQFAHLPEEEGEQQGADVRAVDVGIRHDDDLVVAAAFRC